MRRILTLAAVTAALIAVWVLLRDGTDATAVAQLTIEPVAVDAAAGSSEPQLFASRDRAILSWIEQVGSLATLKFAERTGSGWSDPRTVASGENWFLNFADVPSVVLLDDGTLAAHWLQRSGISMFAYDVRLSWSRDDGATWTPAVTPHHDGTSTQHGFASLFQLPGARLGLVWLDGRASEVPDEDGHPGAMTLRSTAFDATGQQKAEILIADRVCDCCPTATAGTADGVIAAYRNRTADEIRDIYVARYAEGAWTEPKAVHDDRWRLEACPVNGPGVAASGRDVAVAWFTAAGGQGHSFVAFSSNSGDSFGTPIRLDDVRSLGHVDVDVLEDGSAVAGWIESAEGRSEFRVRRVRPQGQRSASQVVSRLESGVASSYPRLARRGDELLFAWTEAGYRPRVRTAVARVP